MNKPATISDAMRWLGLGEFWDARPKKLPADFEPTHDKPIPDQAGQLELGCWHDMFLSWPPDVFAAIALLLEQSGAYRRAVSPPELSVGHLDTAENWANTIERGGSIWANAISFRDIKSETKIWDVSQPFWSLPQQEAVVPNAPEPAVGTKEELADSIRFHDELFALWAELWEHRDTPIRTLAYKPDGFWAKLIRLFCLADSACEGVGKVPRRGDRPASQLQYWAQLQLLSQTVDQQLLEGKRKQGHDENVLASTLCRRADRSRFIVLPKLRTPQRGITLRSLSLHIGFHSGGDILPLWSLTESDIKVRISSPEEDRPSAAAAHNLLVIPYPYEAYPIQFRRATAGLPESTRLRALERRFGPKNGLFSYEPHDETPEKLRTRVETLIGQARATVGPVRGVVMPEASVSASVFDRAFPTTWPCDIDFLICGVTEPPTRDLLGRNYAVIRCPRVSEGHSHPNWTFLQDKHHRWALDENQISTYGLASMLHPGTTWWESIHIPRRKLHFMSLGRSMIYSVLICEDLARPDPIGDLVRTVGPNLVIALLQDGPQLAERWPGRFAVPLSDDPGSAVLSVTSAGMAALSRPNHGHEDRVNRTVALWRDSDGVVKEIALPSGAEAIVLSLSEIDTPECSADGRTDQVASARLKLGGVVAIDRQGMRLPE